MGPPRPNPPERTQITHESSPFINQVPPDPSASQSPPSLGMSPESRYQHNLKVLRRRDPSIMSIFDQFSHVCVYHHDGTKWEKHGFEGSMFLFERNAYPPYGFYILNRMGMEDYIQGIYPEDEISPSGSYLIIRSYPQFMANRLSGIQASLQGKLTPDKFSDVYAIPNIDQLTSQSKGESKIVGLWMFPTDEREPLTDVMKRLHSYVRLNLPYPDEHRYGPVRPPPSHRLRAAPKSRQATSSEASDSQASYSDSEGSVVSSTAPVSEVDKLFAKFVPTPTHSAPPMSLHTLRAPTMNVESLFAVASGGFNATHSVPVSPTPSSTGISLLDSIFASASVSSITSPMPGKAKIFSPAPTISALPQVLNQDVISTLLGLPPSRTASAASTSYSSGARSHATSREGDNEADSDSNISAQNVQHSTQSEGSFSESGTVYGTSNQCDSSLLGVPGFQEKQHNNLGRINGDVTPRAFLNGTHVSAEGMVHVPSVLEAASSISTVRGSQPSEAIQIPAAPAKDNVKPRANRPLVPFEPDSELWPYSPSIIGDVQTELVDGGEAEIVELDFEDTSVLSDPDAFLRALKTRDDSRNGRANQGKQKNGKEKGKGKKKGRQALERAEIENSWDVPEVYVPSTPPHLSPEVYLQQALALSPASPSPSPSPPASPSLARSQTSMQKPVYSMDARLTTGNKLIPAVVPNGQSPIQPSPIVSSGKAKKVHLNGGPLKSNQGDDEVVKDSIVAAIEGRPKNMRHLERNEFVREVLTLIHTDKGFVDNLWQEYRTRLG